MHNPRMGARRTPLRSHLASSLMVGALAVSLTLLGSCGFPAFDFRETENPVDGGADAKPSCPSVGSDGGIGNACTSLPRFTGTQRIDGVGDELCALALDAWDKRTTPFQIPTPPTADVDPRAELRVGWSSVGLHLHVHVVDPTGVIVSPPEASVAESDSVEIYASGFVPTGGDYDDVSDLGAIHVIVTPPGAGLGARANIFDSRYDHAAVAMSPSLYAVRIVSDGYEVEMQLPWTLISRTAPPSSGAGIGFDVALNKDRASDHKRILQTFLGYRTDPVTPSSCTISKPEPWCDDRTWCVPKLE